MLLENFFFLFKMRGGRTGLGLENRQGIVVSDTSPMKGVTERTQGKL